MIVRSKGTVIGYWNDQKESAWRRRRYMAFNSVRARIVKPSKDSPSSGVAVHLAERAYDLVSVAPLLAAYPSTDASVIPHAALPQTVTHGRGEYVRGELAPQSVMAYLGPRSAL